MVFSTELYDVFGISPSATQAEIGKVFRAKALKLHPDKRNSADLEKAQSEFQLLSAAYEVLKDPESRAEYDATGLGGITEPEHADNEAGLLGSLRRFIRRRRPLTTEDIENFARDYKNSAMEEDDLIAFYEKMGGDISKLFEYIPLSDYSESERFIALIDKLISQDKLRPSKNLSRTKASLRKKAAKAAKSTKSASQKKKHDKALDPPANSLASLIAAIKTNETSRRSKEMASLEQLEAKYGNKKHDKTHEIYDFDESPKPFDGPESSEASKEAPSLPRNKRSKSKSASKTNVASGPKKKTRVH